VVKENSADLIVDALGTWDIIPIKNNKNLLLQGHYNGLNVIEKINNTWQFRNEIEGFDIACRYFGFNSNNQIFVNHEYKGVFKLNVDEDFTKVTASIIDESAPKGLKSSLINFRNNLLYSCEDGVYKYNDQLQQFIKDPLLSINLYAHDNFVTGKLIADDQEDILWGFTEHNIVYFSPGKLNNALRANKISLTASARQNITGYESITHINNDLHLFGTSSGYFIMDLNKLKNKEYEININSIEKSLVNDERSSVSTDGIGDFKYRENNLFFSYSVPEFDKYDEVNYQYQLEGLYNEWSDWSDSNEVSFNHLPFGTYTFNVRARIGNKISRNTASYSFEINRHWLISNVMLLVYVALFIVTWYLIHNIYKRYYNKQKNRLLEKKQRAFAMAQLENEKVIMKLKNEKLKHDINSKSRELAASTMSIIKKNELLSTIKNELEAVKHDTNVKPVIKIINKNLSDKSDWKMFREAFNNVDRGFIKNLKSIHPNLTPKDLRLCSYLRLNLVSKEIAPLLNISARSVEIKRYRLRKKMDLPHEKSLVEYILEI
jgi:DNA-binding CsgD family transcriptional regulator